MKDNDVAALWIAESVRQPGTDDTVSGHDCIFHGAAWNLAVCDDEVVQNKGDDGRRNNNFNPAYDLGLPVKCLALLQSVIFLFHRDLLFYPYILSIREFK